MFSDPIPLFVFLKYFANTIIENTVWGGKLTVNTIIGIIRHALVAVDVPPLLKPNSLVRDDGKRPDIIQLEDG